MKKPWIILVCIVLVSCQRSPSEVVNKVLTDFGIRKPPPGQVSESDKIFKQLDPIGAAEQKRLNLDQGQGVVKYQSEGLRGMYYKEKKVYESYYPLEASAIGKGSDVIPSGYYGYIEFSYRLYQSGRVSTRTEAMAKVADIPTDTMGREVYRYTLGTGGEWDGGKGQKMKN
ncbi:MAG TPA: hypothetical protein PLI09_07115 [Candidatus Hydrogenedentes bacterium]|nr:hypothetical protein [Candidatus Hydrogenedentota bacterium]